jgi:prepilin-type N-terminal cleavage/methylation domain-containing protein
MQKPNHRARGGFTLIEILCVVFIFSIAAAIVIAGIGSQGDLQAQSAAREVMADLLYAQNQAIATQQNVYVYFNTAGKTYYLYKPWGTTLTNPISEHAYSTSWSAASWTVSSVNFGGSPAVYFDSLGEPWSCDNTGSNGALLSSTGTVQITSDGKSMTISIQPSTGDMTVQ